MARIDRSECFCMDMEWYGVDRNGNIAVFCSAGEGYLPEFVCEDVERAEELMEYFDTVEKITDSSLFFKSIERAEQVAREFSDKGLYYFDSGFPDFVFFPPCFPPFCALTKNTGCL